MRTYLHGWNLQYETQDFERYRSEMILWSKSGTVGIPSVGDTFPFTFVSSPYVLLLFGPRIWSCSYLLGNQWEPARGDSLGDEVRVGEVSLTQPPLVGTL